MYLPNYQDGSIVNLMSSIAKALDGKSKYKPLSILQPAELSGSTNVVLLVIDGLGYEYLMKHGQDSLLHTHCRGKITSIFPSTTAACVTTFITGVAPQQHAITGWFMYLKELGTVSTILRFQSRHGGFPFSQSNVKPKKIFNQKSFLDETKAKSYIVLPKTLVESDYNRATAKKIEMVPYKSLSDYFKTIKKVIFSSDKQKYIYAYWPKFDGLSHYYGNDSQEVATHFRKLDKKLSSFLKSLKGTNTTLIITADHGFIDTTSSKIILLKNHPQLAETLTLPLCGEARAAYCYVRPAKVQQFETYVTEQLGHYCDLHKSEDLIAKNYFGLFKPNKKLFDRVGDYILVMKDNYILKDFLLSEKKRLSIGYHGGVSQEEMFVPLIIIKK